MTTLSGIPRVESLNLDAMKRFYSTTSQPIADTRGISIQDTNTEYESMGTRQIYSRTVLRHPGGSAVVPLIHTDAVCVVQYRPALERMVVEIPGGRTQPGESALETARRELREESGLEAADLTFLYSCNAVPCSSDWTASIFLATDLYPVASMRLPELPTMACLVDLANVEYFVRLGVLVDAKTIASLLLVRSLGD
jgi:ADP-ribose pyrophosphatase